MHDYLICGLYILLLIAAVVSIPRISHNYFGFGSSSRPRSRTYPCITAIDRGTVTVANAEGQYSLMSVEEAKAKNIPFDLDP